uniref:Sodium/hydrogen exchanger 3 n=1 Tax=Neolamprologus brichardi TaxID=32507 RepID=A0A3Q4HSB0_NEOBR
MATSWGFTLILCMLLMACGSLSLASEEPRNSQTDNGTGSNSNTTEEGGHGAVPITTLPIVTWKWHHITTQYLVALWILVAWLCKLIIESNHHVTNVIPESVLLICFGFVLGGMIWGADKMQTFSLTPTVFFYFLLPQVILDAGYHMPNKLFFTNLGAILVYAVIGTCWNAASLGLSLWGCHMGGLMGDLDISLLQYLLFGSLMAAVDPVAVIAVFEQVHVNDVLFIIVFGESLLNDGVTVVRMHHCVFFLTWILNRYRLVPLEFIDQVIMSYGGLRGAVAYGLAVMLDENKIKEKNLMVCTTLIVVYFTVIWQGMTMKPLVTWLKVKRAEVKELTLLEKMTNKMFNHTLVAIEDISGQIGHNCQRSKWKYFEEKWMSRILMKPSARKKQDEVFNVFHQLNLKDAMEYVAEGERRGSLEFIRKESVAIDFRKKFESEHSEDMPGMRANMSNGHCAKPTTRDPFPSVSVEMHEHAMKAMNEAEAANAHNLLDQHLYKSRKQHRHRFSRSKFIINKDEKEVQEIFKRTMKNRMESKTGVSPKTVIKHTKKEHQQKIPKGKSISQTKLSYSGDEDFGFSEGDSASGYDSSYPSSPMRDSKPGGGIDNSAFVPDLYPTDSLPIPPWLAEGELDSSMVAPSLRAQASPPTSPMEMRHLGLLRISTRSTDTKQMNNDQLPLPPTPPPPPPPSSHM